MKESEVVRVTALQCFIPLNETRDHELAFLYGDGDFATQIELVIQGKILPGGILWGSN